MANTIATGPIHHIRMTVTDVERSRAFYTGLLGFEVAAEMPAAGDGDDPVARGVAEALMGGVVLRSGNLLFGLRQAGADHQAARDRFDEHRIGLDHLSFDVGSRDALETAARTLDAWGVPHGEIKDLVGFGIYVLAFRDPDNIQLELTAAYA